MASERCEQKRAAFVAQLQTVPKEALVFVDECGFCLNLHRRYGWAPQSERCWERVPFQKGANRSVVGAFSLPSSDNPNGLWALWQNKKAWNTLTFELFMDEVFSLVPRGSVIVLDNARIHKGEGLRAMAEKAGCYLLYLPPYSPDFNPLELVWSWIKNDVRARAPRTDEQRERDIWAAGHALPPQHAPQWFAHCGLY